MKNLSSESKVVPCGLRTVQTKLLVTLCSFANAPKKQMSLFNVALGVLYETNEYIRNFNLYFLYYHINTTTL